MDVGADVLDIGLSGTEELYWATTEFAACGGIEVTASHNPITYNGLKMLKAGSKRLDPASGLPAVRTWAEEKVFATPSTRGSRKDIASEAKSAYVTKLQSFVDVTVLKPLKVVVNSGNGAAGPTFNAIATALGQNAPQRKSSNSCWGNRSDFLRFLKGLGNPRKQRQCGAVFR